MDEKKPSIAPSPSFSFMEEESLFKDIALGKLEEAGSKEKERAEEAAIEVANLYYSYAEGVARKEFFYLDPNTLQDLFQEGWLALIVCAKAYDPSRGVKFSTYSFPYIKKACQNFLKKYDLTSDTIENEPSLEEEEELFDEDSLARLNVLTEALTPRQKEAIGYRFGLFGQEEKKTYAKIGEAMGISSEAARVLVLTGIGKMKGGKVKP